MVMTNLIFWFGGNKLSQFPILSRMVRDVLATPISTISSESAFNIGGRVLDTLRSSLNPPMAEALICAQNWLRITITQFDGINGNEEFELFKKVFTGTSFIYLSSKLPL